MYYYTILITMRLFSCQPASFVIKIIERFSEVHLQVRCIWFNFNCYLKVYLKSKLNISVVALLNQSIERNISDTSGWVQNYSLQQLSCVAIFDFNGVRYDLFFGC